ncbi:MAG: S9 family peptidase [Terriglobales bacterium]
MRRLLPLLACLVATSLAQQSATPPQLTIESIFAEGGITGRGPETIQWSPDNQKISFVQRDDSGEHGQLWYIDAASGKKAVLVAESKLQSLAPPPSRMNAEQLEHMQRYSVAGYQWSPDSKHLLFDSRGQLWYYTLDNGTAVQLTTASEASSDPKFSPDGKRVAFLRKHEIWARSLSGDLPEHQVTKSEDDEILSGEVDWVYEEELGVRSNYFWSPDGKRIAFLEMNEKTVPAYPITDWMPQHPTVIQEKYPKAGDPNPTVRLGVVSADGGKVRWISVGDPKDKDIYIPRFGWVRDGLLYVVVLNRLQTRMDLYLADTGSGRSRLMMSDNEPDAFVDSERISIDFLKGGRFVLPSWRNGHMHLYLYSFNAVDPLGADAKLERQLTRGDFDVSKVNGVNEAAGTVFFTASASDPREAQVFAVDLNGGAMQPLTRERGSHEGTFAHDGQHFADSYSAVGTPARLSLCKAFGPCSVIWEPRSVQAYNLVVPKALELTASDGKTKLYGYLLAPPNFESAARASIPLIIFAYGGPGAQEVRNAWGGSNFLFHNLLVREGFAVLTVDNRGMAGRGKQFANAARHHFGKVELEDQLAALDQVLKQYPALDGKRLGWWGWSYGGYLTLYAMTHSDRIKAGVSVAPVTDWRDYDSIYTERYMGLPKDNAAGYADSSPVNAAKNLHGRLLEAHGTGDDNVHVQNTMQMVRALINAGKPYDLQLFPGKTHGISGATDRSHLYHRIQRHFEEYLLQK